MYTSSIEEPVVLNSSASGKGAVERKNEAPEWKSWQKVAFRIAFVFFVIMCIPANGDWYLHAFKIDWTNLHYRDIYDFCRFSNFTFVNVGPQARWGIGGYANWGIAFLIAAAIGIIWSFFDTKRKNYNVLHYWIRVVVRYRAALGIIGFGFTKLLPVQMPYPSLGLLNSDFGDFSGQKIYWMSIGMVPWYQIFAGVVEVGAGVLLLFRKTTAWGAALLWGALLAIAVVNLGYDGGVHVYASYFVLLSSFLMVEDIYKSFQLLVQEKLVQPAYRFYPVFTKAQQYARVAFKSGLIFVFLILFFYLQFLNWMYDPYKQPSIKGVATLRGNYDVVEFRRNGQLIPFSPLDDVRWQQATFEKWTTLTFKVNKPVQLDLSNGGGDPMRDINRTFEVSGVAGGQRVFYYDADTVNKVLYLQDKNQASGFLSTGPGREPGERGKKKEEPRDSIYPENWIPKEALANIGDDTYKINPRVVNTRRIKAFKEEKPVKARHKMILKYDVLDNGNKIVLRGTDEFRDSIYVVLQKVNRKYALSESELVAGEY